MMNRKCLKRLDVCQLIELEGTLAQTNAILSMFAYNGMKIEGHDMTLSTLANYRQILEREIGQRLKEDDDDS
jgi:hypothetical protein